MLLGRGLQIADTAFAAAVIRRIGYYRFSAYLYPFLAQPKENQQFKEDSDFADAIALYDFDQELRILVFEVVARVEVAIRSAMANIVAKETGNMFWITDRAIYANEDSYKRTKAIIEKEFDGSKEEFIAHFKRKYSNPFPPAWVLVEIMSMGTLNHIYSNIADNALRKKISAEFFLMSPVFNSRLAIIAVTRNACCHHARLWNKENAIKPAEPKRMVRPWLTAKVNPHRLFYNLCILKYFINIISPGNDMTERLESLFSKYPNVDPCAMGFTPDWQSEPLWGSASSN